MARTIKFRCWDKKENVMRGVLNFFANGHVYVDCNCTPIDRLKYHSDKTHHNLSHHLSSNDCEVMQFTGLLDKNGKEIYEGDILGVAEGESGYLSTYNMRWVVKYSSGGFIVVDEKGGYCSTLRQTLPSPLLVNKPHHKSIIGNIYQNPELLPPNHPIEG